MHNLKIISFIFLLLIFGTSFNSFAETNNIKLSSTEKKLYELGIELPDPSGDIAEYLQFNKVGNLLFISAQFPINEGKLRYKGKLGQNISTDKAIEAGKLSALNVLAQIKQSEGSLDNVKKIVKINVYINSTNDYVAHPKITDEVSNLFIKIFGKKGKHARSEIGVASLPFNSPIQIDAVVELKKKNK